MPEIQRQLIQKRDQIAPHNSISVCAYRYRQENQGGGPFWRESLQGSGVTDTLKATQRAQK